MKLTRDPRALVLTAAALVVGAGSPRAVTAQGYGGAVAVVGDQVLVGESQNQALPGLVYVYGGSGSWTETGRLFLSETGAPDGFGRALAAAGAELLVGAPGLEGNAGRVVVYQQASSGGWTEIQRFGPVTPMPGGGFGSAIAISGDLAVISAPGVRDGTGTAYVFERGAGGEWSQVAELGMPDGSPGAGFGASLATDGATALVSTPDRRTGSGAVFAFRRGADGGWSPMGQLNAGAGERSGFGSALAVQGDVALVGSPGAAQRSGVLHVFRLDSGAGEWRPTRTLTGFRGTPRAQFGASVAFHGDEVWVGAPGERGGVGAFYRFVASGSDRWAESVLVDGGELPASAAFGSRVAFGPDVAIAGASGVDNRAGGAVILRRTATGTWEGAASVVGDNRGYPAITGDEVVCEEGAAAGFECNEVNVVSFLPIHEIGGARGTRVNDIWGWTDPDSGREIAIVGRTDGTSFVDVTDASHPRYLGDLPKTEGSRSSIWRDMKVYRDHVYIVADAANEHGMQVFDLRQLREVGDEPVTFEPTFTYDQIHSAHNIVIDEASGFGYAVGSSSGGVTCGGGLHMIRLENPARPEFAGCFADPSTGRSGTGYSHDAQCVVYAGPDTEHAGKQICLGSNETALSIADVTDKENPVAIASISYPNVAYTHQGWLSEDHRYFYQNDEGDEPQGLVEGTRTLVWDLVDLDDPVLVTEYIATTTSTDHNLYVVGDLMYQSNYDSGLRIIDISVPTNPVEIAYFDTTPYGGGGSWSNYPYFASGFVVATSMGEGLFVLKNTGRRHLIP